MRLLLLNFAPLAESGLFQLTWRGKRIGADAYSVPCHMMLGCKPRTSFAASVKEDLELMELDEGKVQGSVQRMMGT